MNNDHVLPLIRPQISWGILDYSEPNTSNLTQAQLIYIEESSKDRKIL